MNRLIIVGNGFDLAHGLKTSYCDFIENYINNVFSSFEASGDYEDSLLHLRQPYRGASTRIPRSIGDSVYDIIRWLINNKKYDFKIKSVFFIDTVFKAGEMRWVDLENEYFEHLTKLIDKLTPRTGYTSIIELNNQFTFLKSTLDDYLQTVNIKSFKPSEKILSLFNLDVDRNHIVLPTSNFTLRNKLFLNFNYTDTLNQYIGKTHWYSRDVREWVDTQDTIIHIHGELGSIDNPIVFGFGDEYDEHYQKFESHKNNSLFTHIKSFAYFKTRNYHNLVRYIDSEEFEVFVVGHSCGLSDRTMFREIFEHNNCKSIKIFYYERPDGSTDFTEKTFEIARHFSDKGVMRKKINSEPNSLPLPQYVMS